MIVGTISHNCCHYRSIVLCIVLSYLDISECLITVSMLSKKKSSAEDILKYILYFGFAESRL